MSCEQRNSAEYAIRKELEALRRKVKVLEHEKQILKQEADFLKKRELHSRQEGEILLQEVYHRVKNNLQIILSLLQLQKPYFRDKNDIDLFVSSYDRIYSMALLHDQLYQAGDIVNLNVRAYVSELLCHLLMQHDAHRVHVETDVEVSEVRLDQEKIIPFGLIITELISNSLRHAFSGGREGSILVALKQADRGNLVLSVQDDGPGVAPKAQPAEECSLGLLLIDSLVGQLQGKLKLSEESGFSCRITFPATAVTSVA